MRKFRPNSEKMPIHWMSTASRNIGSANSRRRSIGSRCCSSVRMKAPSATAPTHSSPSDDGRLPAHLAPRLKPRSRQGKASVARAKPVMSSFAPA